MSNILRQVKEFAEERGLATRVLYNREDDNYCMVGAIGQGLGLDIEAAMDSGLASRSEAIYEAVGNSKEGLILAKTIAANYPKYQISLPGMPADCVIFRFNDSEPLEDRIQMLDKAAVELDSLVE